MLVPLLDLRLDPVDEVLLSDCRAHVDDPLLTHLVDLLVVGHVVEHMPVELAEVDGDVSQGQAFVLGHLDVPDLGAKDAYTK